MDIGLLLLIVFIIAPLLEKLLQAGRPKQPPQQRRPGQPQPRQQAQRRPTQRPTPEPRAETEEEPAAAMLPDDLWEILTGERRPQAPPREPAEPEPTFEAQRREERVEPPVHSRAPRPVPDRTRAPQRERRLPKVETRRLPDVEDRRLPPVEIRRPGPTVRPRAAGPPPSAADDLVRGVPVHEAPVVVSMETPIEDPETRRRRFRERLAATARARTPAEAPPNPWAPTSDEDLRRAIVMAEILGPPKGLQ